MPMALGSISHEPVADANKKPEAKPKTSMLGVATGCGVEPLVVKGLPDACDRPAVEADDRSNLVKIDVVQLCDAIAGCGSDAGDANQILLVEFGVEPELRKCRPNWFAALKFGVSKHGCMATFTGKT